MTSPRLTVHPDPASAIKSGHFAQVRYLLELTRTSQRNKSLALSLCALVVDESWRFSLVQTLLEYGARLDTSVDQWGLFPLHYAVLYNRSDLTELLLSTLDNGFKFNQADAYGNTALHIAILAAESDLVFRLISYMVKYDCKVNSQNRIGMTPLMIAYRLSRTDVTNKLIQVGADLFKLKDILGYTAHDYRKCFTYVAQEKNRMSSRRSTIIFDPIAGKDSCASNSNVGESTRESKACSRSKEKLATRLQHLHNPLSNVLSTYPIPMDLKEPFYVNNAMKRRLESTLIHVAHHADSRNDCTTLFNLNPLELFKRKLLVTLRAKKQTKNLHQWQNSLSKLMALKSEQSNSIFMRNSNQRSITRTSHNACISVS
ncbi:hypothetical protein Ciccas_000910 [Cichlidogyrus casuarinus]|uniref:ANK_REP_REGION domain-containing protein n=1 Tax=Cichlidogyrus casuarinus TaxID=1844966 RepID=A0ABD2QLL0_9PLAT